MSATLNGHTVSRAVVQVPAWGVPWVEADLTAEVTLAGACTLVIGGVTIACTVVHGGPYQGASYYRLAVGAAGWGKILQPTGFQDDGGVKHKTILTSVASQIGETLGTVDNQLRVAGHFALSADPASYVLNQLYPRAWHVDFAGVTQLSLRAPATYSGDAPRVKVDPGGSIIELATDDLTGLVPGVSVDGSAAAQDVEYELTSNRLVARLYCGTRPSRRLDAYRRIVDACDPWRRYRCLHEYRIVSQSGERYNLQIARVSTGLPDLRRVPVRPGVAGTRWDAKLGGLVLVAFAGGDPSRPGIVAWDAPDAPGWLPTLVEIGESSDFAALAGKVGTEIQRIRTWADAHTHPTGVGPSGPPAAPTTAHQSVACTHVRVQ